MAEHSFPADSPEAQYLAREIPRQIKALEKSGAPLVSVPTPAAPAPEPEGWLSAIGYSIYDSLTRGRP